MEWLVGRRGQQRVTSHLQTLFISYLFAVQTVTHHDQRLTSLVNPHPLSVLITPAWSLPVIGAPRSTLGIPTQLDSIDAASAHLAPTPPSLRLTFNLISSFEFEEDTEIRMENLTLVRDERRAHSTVERVDCQIKGRQTQADCERAGAAHSC